MRVLAALVCLLLVALACVRESDASISSKSRLRKISEDEIGAKSISAEKLQRWAVENKNLQPQSVTGSKIADNSVDDRHISPDSATAGAFALDEVTIILRAENSVSATGGGAIANPTNRIALKPLGSDGRVENHHVRPDGFHSAFGRASGPGTIVGWYPSLNGHLLRYQPDRALRDLSCSGVPSLDHKIRKYDVNVADYASVPGTFDCTGTDCIPRVVNGNHFLPRFFLTGNSGPILDMSAIATVTGGSERWPGIIWPGLVTDVDDDADDPDVDGFDFADTHTPFNFNSTYVSTILTRTHVQKDLFDGNAILLNGVGLPRNTPRSNRDYDLRGTRDVHYLSHRYIDIEYPRLCGDLTGMGTLGPDNIKCFRAQPWQERQYRTNDARSFGADTEDDLRPDFLEPNAPTGVVRDSMTVLERGFVDALYDISFSLAAQVPNPAFGWEFATGNSPPERCSIYTNIGDVRTETYEGLIVDPTERPIDIPGPAEGTPIYSPTLERIAIDDTGLIEVRYAGRGLPGASQPDIAITVMVLRNDAVQYRPSGSVSPSEVFP